MPSQPVRRRRRAAALRRGPGAGPRAGLRAALRRGLGAALLLLPAGALAVSLPACSALSSSHDKQMRVVPRDFTGHMQVWWSDDRLREDGDYRDGRRHGHVRGYHPDGSLAFEGDFDEGVPSGQLDQHYPGGALAIRETLDEGTPQGVRTEFYPDGSVVSTLQVVDGRAHGELLRYHPGAGLALRGRYEHGAPSGLWQQWDEQQRLVSETRYWLVNGESAGYLETAYDTEGRIAVQTRMLLQDGTWLGRVTMWYPNGAQAGLVETVNGMRHGRDVAWDAQHRKRSEGRRIDDLREGRWTFWDERGFVERSVDYAADKPVAPEAPAEPDGAQSGAAATP